LACLEKEYNDINTISIDELKNMIDNNPLLKIKPSSFYSKWGQKLKENQNNNIKELIEYKRNLKLKKIEKI
jgi:hypothetical protein